MKTVRAKFLITSVSPVAGSDEGKQITLSPVVAGSEENEAFYKLTPGGNIALNIVSDETASNFVAGKECYVDFSFPEEEAKETE